VFSEGSFLRGILFAANITWVC